MGHIQQKWFATLHLTQISTGVMLPSFVVHGPDLYTCLLCTQKLHSGNHQHVRYQLSIGWKFSSEKWSSFEWGL